MEAPVASPVLRASRVPAAAGLILQLIQARISRRGCIRHHVHLLCLSDSSRKRYDLKEDTDLTARSTSVSSDYE